MAKQKVKKVAKKSNAGRKAIEDKKVPVIIYPRKSRLDKLGKALIQRVAVEAVEREYNSPTDYTV